MGRGPAPPPGAEWSSPAPIRSAGRCRSTTACLRRAGPSRPGIDSRWPIGGDAHWSALAGSRLFGCSFGAPLALLLEVNGFDELCDPIGGEDYHLGIRLEWAGTPLYYSRRMLTMESEELHQCPEPTEAPGQVHVPGRLHYPTSSA